MKECDDPHQPSAVVALSRYEEICSRLTADEIAHEVKMLRWDKGNATHCDTISEKLTLSQDASSIAFRPHDTSQNVDTKTRIYSHLFPACCDGIGRLRNRLNSE